MQNVTESIMSISKEASRFSSSIVLQHETAYIDVKSIMGLFVTLTSNKKYALQIVGPDSDEAKKAMQSVFAKYGFEISFL